MIASDRPRLESGVRLRRDGVHGALLLVPEGLLKLNATAAATLQLIDGKRTIDDVVAALSARFEAPPETTARDVVELLERLASRGYVTA